MTSPSEIYIESTETDPVVRAQSVLQQTNQRLQGRLATLTEIDPVADARESVRTAWADFCTGEARRYLNACDQTLYAAAAGAAETRLLVRALRTTASVVHNHIDRLPSADSAASAGIVRATVAVLRTHLAVERNVLLPALVRLPDADLPALVADLDTLLSGGRLETPAVIDVREIPHGQRHPRIFTRFARLAPGETFTLVNNHDPKPPHREFQSAHPGTFTWEYVESGPEQWQVRIGRQAGSDG
ncbi:DUF2249 domain-containing protein [Streptomyces anandii]|uniref:DUF2249 domain-containing protein n=1 Tax=Streptomyces anandii TaxID=285454 RepID=A0ABW6HBZ7_9ACTN